LGKALNGMPFSTFKQFEFEWLILKHLVSGNLTQRLKRSFCFLLIEVNRDK